MQIEAISNIDDLVGFLAELILEEYRGDIDIKRSVEINNSAGKIINAMKVKIVYLQTQHQLGDKKTEIGFLEGAKLAGKKAKLLQEV